MTWSRHRLWESVQAREIREGWIRKFSLMTADFSEAEAQSVAVAYAARFGAAPDILHAQTGDGAMVL